MPQRKIRPNERVTVPFSERDRELLADVVFADLECTCRSVPAPIGTGLVGEFTLEDLEDLLGCIAAEANHTAEKKRQKELDRLHDRLFRIQRSYDDGNWNDSEA